MEKIKIYLHVPKTGGTTIVRHLKKNYKENDLIVLNERKIDFQLHKTKRNYDFYLKNVENFFRKLPNEKIMKIKVITGHIVPFGIEKIIKREAEYYTTLRQPVDRIISFFNYYKTGYLEDNLNKKYFDTKYLINGKEPDFQTWLKTKFSNSRSTIENTNYKDYFQILGYYKKNIEEIFSKFKFVALTEKSEDDFLYLYNILNINKFLVNQNVSIKFEKLNNINRLKYSKLLETDLEIYNTAKNSRKIFVYNNKNFKAIVNKMKTKKKILTIFTQLIYDPIEFMRITNSRIRRKSQFYANFLDKIKSVLKIHRFLPK